MRFDRVVVDVNKTLGDLRFTKSKLKDRFGVPNAKDCVVTVYLMLYYKMKLILSLKHQLN